MNIRNCTEADILRVLGGTIIECTGTQNEILASIVLILGGTITNDKSRNSLLEDILQAI
jgi:hypothetical protein